MSLSAGTRIGPYEVVAPLGAGGMGEVYRARDSKLGRDVALKVLSPALACDADYMARFHREARVLASLNHPNIAAIYGLEENALVMELVEGPTLAERIAQRPIPLEEALGLARQMAEGLEYAHEKGIVHRDLKPANVKITPDGGVKVLDFGLAKALKGEPAPGDPDTSPTLTIAATGAGVILGTAGYMSPEQARGRPADKRADIWAFGVVLFEMMAGQRLFHGETVSDTLASVLKEPIDWSRLPPATPPAIRRLLRRCLERDRKKRLHDIADALLEIDEVQEGEAERVSKPRRAALPWVLAAVLALVVIGLGVVAFRRPGRPPEQPLMRLNVDLGPNAVLTPGFGAKTVLSPDGARLVYVANGPEGKPQLAMRRLDRAEATLLAGTHGAVSPFFSPDGQWVGFFAEGKLKKIAVAGGAAAALCDAPIPLGGSWAEDGAIIAGMHATAGLSTIPSAGGQPRQITEPDTTNAEDSHRWPQVLPGGKAVLFTAGIHAAIGETGSVVVQSLKDKRRKVLRRGGYYGRYLPSGHLVYVQQGALFAVRFDPETWDLTGEPAVVVEQVASGPGAGVAQFDFSRTGTLVYVSGSSDPQSRSLMWLDSAGKLAPLPAKPGYYQAPRLSPDGKRVALGRMEAGSRGLWVYEWQRDIMNRLSVSSLSTTPVWSNDGKHIVCSTASEIRWIRADGSSTAKRPIASDGSDPFSFSPDGKRLAFTLSTKTGRDIWTLPLEGGESDDPKPGKPELFLGTQSTERDPAFSPDGRWLAYSSNESGTFEICVRPFPVREARWQVSNGGGRFPVWSRTRPELFYQTADGHIMVATYTVKVDSFVPEAPRLWSEKPIPPTNFFWNFDLAPDGNRVIALMPPPGAEEDGPQTRLTFLLNFFDELRRRVPAGK